MAEFVQQSIEEMLPELEQMERVGLFTGVETRSILRKRKAFEYKLQRRTKFKEDYLQYIQYEMNLLALVKKRRQRIGYSFKKMEIDGAIGQRIQKLFRIVTYRFQNDVDLWLSHIDFCQKKGEKATVGKLFTRLLQVHNRKPDLWILAAKFEMDSNKSMENSRLLLQRALRFNPTSKKLWQEYFRMELLGAEKLRKRREILGIAKMEDDEDMTDAALNGLVALVVFRKAMENFPDDPTFCLSFLPIVQLFDFAENIEEAVYSHADTQFPLNEEVLDAKARRPLQAALKTKPGEKLTEAVLEERLEEAEVRCHSLYEEAVKTVPTEKMWGLYIRALTAMLKEESSEKKIDKRVDKVLIVCAQAAAAGLLEEELYSQWVQALLNVGRVEEAMEAAGDCVESYRKSVRAWEQKITVAIRCMNDADTVYQLFRDALSAVSDEESLPLWEMAVEWCAAKSPDKMEALLAEGLTRCREVCCLVKEKSLEWAFLQGDVHTAREMYKRLTESKPVSLDLYSTYISIEKSQVKKKAMKMRKAYEAALDNFGSTRPDLWLDYIRFEMDDEDGSPELAGKLHWRALKILEGHLVEEFVTKYTLLQSGVKV